MEDDSRQPRKGARTGTTVASLGLDGPLAAATAAVLTVAVVLALLLLASRTPSGVGVDATSASNLWLVLLTGATVGGISCLAVQGGLLAALIARREARLQGEPIQLRESAGPVLQFLSGKILAYTSLGALLGAFGTRIPLALQGWLLIAIGLFLMLAVLQLLDVHPFFRRFSPSPPKPVQRLVRRGSRRTDALGPWLLGGTTVLVPCGVTLGMELLAVASHSAVRGALVMFAFTVGTVPSFLVLGLAAAQLGRRAYPIFKPLAATVIAVVGVTAVLSGARLAGLPAPATYGQALTHLSGLKAAPTMPPGENASQSTELTSTPQDVTLLVKTGKFEPTRVLVEPYRPVRLSLVTDGTRGCIRAFAIPSLGIERMLPETGTEALELPPSAPGRSIPFMCSMGMYSGVIEVANS